MVDLIVWRESRTVSTGDWCIGYWRVLERELEPSWLRPLILFDSSFRTDYTPQ